MYKHCLYCHSDLGTNDVIEHFRVGRRLAFDAARGRLWVVCRKCERWNLTPLEARWEAIEECERAFSGTRLRVATDNVGLAQLSEGLTLVRIGSPLLPEFAAWRYGDQFGRRYRRNMVFATAAIAAGTAAFVSGPVLGLAVGGAFSAINSATLFFNLYNMNRARARVPIPGKDRPALVRVSQLSKFHIVSEGKEWHLRMPYDRGLFIDRQDAPQVTVTGDDALRVAATILAVTNHAGANRKRVSRAVALVSANPDPSSLFIHASRKNWKVDFSKNRWTLSDDPTAGRTQASLANIPSEMRLALEIATHQDVERRAMEGELALLEEAWRQAEEIASIADRLAVPHAVEADLERLGGGSAGGSRGGESAGESVRGEPAGQGRRHEPASQELDDRRSRTG